MNLQDYAVNIFKHSLNLIMESHSADLGKLSEVLDEFLKADVALNSDQSNLILR